MRVLITGGTGFIGRRLVGALVGGGHEVTVLTRDRIGARKILPPDTRVAVFDPHQLPAKMSAADTVVNLAGAGIVDKRWTEDYKRTLVTSRLDTTRALVEGMRIAPERPKTFISASAVGYYGNRGDEALDEKSDPGEGFLARLCVDWEAEATKATDLGARTVIARIGIVIGPNGGALAKMLPLFKMGLGGALGGGEQMMSWVQIDDAVGMILNAIDNESLTGPVNVTAPNPVNNADFGEVLGKALRKPYFLPTPAFALRLALGEMASMLLEGQKALPAKMTEADYEFLYPDLDEAIRASLDEMDKPGGEDADDEEAYEDE